MKSIVNVIIFGVSLFSTVVIVRVDGAASFSPTVFCTDIDDASLSNVCATASYTSPSPMMWPNGTTQYVGGYSTSYTIVQGLKEGSDYFGAPENDAGITIDVVRDDNDKCTVSVALMGVVTNCDFCSYCGDESYQVDCSNIKHGRSVDVCESAAMEVVFFPLTAQAIMMLPPTTMMTTAPVMTLTTPVKAPVKMAPVNAPVKKAPVVVKVPVKVPVKTPVVGGGGVMAPRKAPVKVPVMGGGVRAPRKAPVKAPRKPAVKAPRTVGVKAPVGIKAPVGVKAPVKALRNVPDAIAKAPVKAPRKAPIAGAKAPVVKSPVAVKSPRTAPVKAPVGAKAPVKAPRKAPVSTTVAKSPVRAPATKQ